MGGVSVVEGGGGEGRTSCRGGWRGASARRGRGAGDGVAGGVDGGRVGTGLLGWVGGGGRMMGRGPRGAVWVVEAGACWD